MRRILRHLWHESFGHPIPSVFTFVDSDPTYRCTCGKMVTVGPGTWSQWLMFGLSLAMTAESTLIN